MTRKTLRFEVGPDLVEFVPIARGDEPRHLWRLSGLHTIRLNGIERGWVGYERGMRAGHKVQSSAPQVIDVDRPTITTRQVWDFKDRDFKGLAEHVPDLRRRYVLRTPAEAMSAAIAEAAQKRNRAALQLAQDNARNSRWAQEKVDAWRARVDRFEQLVAMRDRLQGLGATSNSEAALLADLIAEAEAAAQPPPDRRSHKVHPVADPFGEPYRIFE